MQVVTVSLPRSGNVFLIKLLKAYFRDDMSRCNLFGGAECCGALPCQKSPTSFRVVRTHDPLVRVPASIKCVVQHREPLGHFLSYIDYGILRGTLSQDMGERLFEKFAVACAVNAVRFLRRQNEPGALVLPYAALSENPAFALGAAIRHLGLEPDQRRVKLAADTQRKLVGRRLAYVPRDLSRSEVVPFRIAKAFEAAVREHCDMWPSTDLQPNERFSAKVRDLLQSTIPPKM